MRVLPNIQDSFTDIESTITAFLSAIFGSEIDGTTRNWTSVPIRDGGMAIPKPKDMANLNFKTSQCQCTHLIQALTNKTPFDLIFHQQTIAAVRTEHQNRKKSITDTILQSIEYEKSSTPHFKRHIKYIQEKGTGQWLAAMPNVYSGTILSPTEFRDELRLRYKLPLLQTPTHCDGCTARFSVSHALSCKVGGLIKTRHDESRDIIGCMACAGFQPSNVRDEPLIHPCRGTTELRDSTSGIEMEIQERGDLLVRGFWTQNTDCIIDVRICDVNQPSYLVRKPSSIIKSSENDKKRKYLDACLEQRRHFTPFVVSCEGLFGKEADFFMKRLAKKLADKWKRPYSTTISLLRTRFAINLVRSKNRCIRGARSSVTSMSFPIDWEDGAGLNLFSTLE